MNDADHASRPDITAIVRELGAAGIRYVVTGSIAAAAYGVPVESRDFDIAPDLNPENLARLADLLRQWGARPVPEPDWPGGLTSEECERWTPDPPTSDKHGLVDVVPTRSCSYQDLIRRANTITFEGRSIMVAHPADLITTLRMHKSKHQARLPQLDAIRERLERGEAIPPRLPSG